MKWDAVFGNEQKAKNGVDIFVFNHLWKKLFKAEVFTNQFISKRCFS
jgi:hypothetical protein